MRQLITLFGLFVLAVLAASTADAQNCWVCHDNACLGIVPSTDQGGTECLIRCRRICICWTRGVCPAKPASPEEPPLSDQLPSLTLQKESLETVQAKDPLLGEFLLAFTEPDGSIKEAVIRSGTVTAAPGSTDWTTFEAFSFSGEIKIDGQKLVVDLKFRGHPRARAMRAEISANRATGSVKTTTLAGTTRLQDW